MAYPASYITPINVVDTVDLVRASDENTAYADILAIETVLGLLPLTISDTTTPIAVPGSIGDMLDMIANLIKQITGRSAWYLAPEASIHTILSTFLALPGAPTRGDILFYDTGGWALLPHGNEGDSLFTNGGVPLWLAPSPIATLTTTTPTTLVGIIMGDGGTLAEAIAGIDYVAPNAGIVGATFTKITYDAKGLVTSGTDATTADIADSTDRRYVTDAEEAIIDNTSGVNTGDVIDATITITDVTTQNASTTKHGWALKAVAPAAGLVNVIGIANTETIYKMVPLFDTTNPAALGIAGPGTAVITARRDHIHTMPTLDGVAAPTDVTTLDATTSAHGLALKATAPASGLINVLGLGNGETVYKMVALLDDTNPAALGAVGPGTAIVAARRDHIHANPAIDTLAAATDITTLNASTSAHGLALKATAPAAGLINVLGIANGETVYKMVALFDTTNPAALGTTGPGTAVIAARRDHIHSMPTAANVGALSNSVTSTQEGYFGSIHLKDVSGAGSFYVKVEASDTQSGDRLFNIANGDADRTLTMHEDLSVLGSSSINGIFSGSSSGVNTGDQTLPIDTTITTTDVTGNNASTSKHGWALKATAPASGLINVLGIANGETVYKMVALFDTTNPAAVGTAAAGPGTQVISARRDHIHTLTLSISPVWTGNHSFSGLDSTPLTAYTTYTDYGGTGVAASIALNANSTADNAGSYIAMSFATRTQTGNTHLYTGVVIGVQGFAYHDGSNTLTSLYATKVGSRAENSGDVSTLIGLFVNCGLTAASSGNCTSAYSVYCADIFALGSGAITTQYGVFVAALTSAGTNYAFYSTGAGLFRVGDTTDASAVGTASSIFIGGVSIAKKLYIGNQINSTLAIGTAPLVITSTTKVANLNVDLLDGYDTSQVGPESAVVVVTDTAGFVNSAGWITSNSIHTSGTRPAMLQVIPGAHTGQTSVEQPMVTFDFTATFQFAAGSFATQRAVKIIAPTYAIAGGGGTITSAATFAITDAPAAGAGATLTNKYALWVQAGATRLAGAFSCNNATPQTAAASGGAAPAGGTGATAGAYDTAAHRDALITLVNNMRTALVNNGIMS